MYREWCDLQKSAAESAPSADAAGETGSKQISFAHSDHARDVSLGLGHPSSMLTGKLLYLDAANVEHFDHGLEPPTRAAALNEPGGDRFAPFDWLKFSRGVAPASRIDDHLETIGIVIKETVGHPTGFYMTEFTFDMSSRLSVRE